MEMYFMTVKEFMKHFVKLVNSDDVLRYQYVIISNSVRSNETRENVAKANNLYPSHRIIADWIADKDEETFFTAYYAELEERRISIAAILDCALSQDIDTVFINGKEESSNVPYMKVISDFIWNEFGIPMYDFKHIRNGKDEFIKYNQKKATQKVHEFVEEYRKKTLDLNSMGNHARNKYLQSLPKKDLKKHGRNIGLSKDDLSRMTRPEIVDMLNTYYS